MKPIRNSAKAVIIKDGKVLFTKNKDDWGFFYLLPGGGQEAGETIHEALKRECREEISSEIKIGDILFVRDYIGKNHEFAEWDNEIHQIEYMFECALEQGTEIKNGSIPDNMQVGVEWIEIEKLGDLRIYPSILKDLLDEKGKKVDVIYLGDIN